MYLKDLEPSKEQLVRALSYHKNEQSFLTLGKILLVQGDVSGAIDVYKQVSTSEPSKSWLEKVVFLFELDFFTISK